LLGLADINPKAAKEKADEDETPKPEDEQKTKLPLPPKTVGGLHYNIEIHLPATKDIEVFNAIFKSLRDHLIG
jgi:hypothetical protein